MTDDKRTYRYYAIAFDDLRHSSLSEEVEQLRRVEREPDAHPDYFPVSMDTVHAFRIEVYNDEGTRQEAETAEAVYVEAIGRLGIAWGADATWADVDDLESGIEMWLNDGEAWEARN